MKLRKTDIWNKTKPTGYPQNTTSVPKMLLNIENENKVASLDERVDDNLSN